MVANQDIRQEANAAGVLLWRIAERYGLCDSSFSRKLRHELPEADKEKIRSIISELSGRESA